jgi:paraquat-inducible protein A
VEKRAGVLVAAVIVCASCDLAHQATRPEQAGRVICVRCRAPLQRAQDAHIETAIGLAVTGLVLYIFSNLYPLVVIQVNGTTRRANLLDAAAGLYRQGHPLLSALVFLTIVAAPVAQIGGMLYLLVPLQQGRAARGQKFIFRALVQVRMWSFVEVFMLGALVATVRLTAYAKVIPGVALWSFGTLMLTLAALTHVTSPEQYWHWAERRRA